MTHTRLLLIVLTMLVSSISSAQVSNDLSRQKLKGKITTLTEYEYSASGDSLISSSISKFDAKGMQLSYSTYSASKAFLSQSVFVYNDSGRLLAIERHKDDGTLIVRTKCSYDN